MKYNFDALQKQEIPSQAFADRVWCGLVSVLLHPGASINKTKMALGYLTSLTILHSIANKDQIDHVAIDETLQSAAKWLESL